MSELLLDRAALKRLTGRTKKDAQKRVLEERRIPFTEDGDGRPVVLWASVERKILGKAKSAEPRQGPDFSAFPAVS
jgi:hypothetical protein